MIRHFGAMLALLLLSLSGVAADTIKVVVPFAAGGPVDLLARLVSSDMQTRLNTEMVIENRGGGGGVIATEHEANFQSALNHVYHTTAHPSYLILPVIAR